VTSSLSRRDAWQTVTPQPMRTIGEAVRRLQGRTTAVDEHRITARLGSPFLYRMLGAYLRSERRRFPLDLTIETTTGPGGRWHIDMTLVSATGWYLVEAGSHRRAFDQRCAEVIAVLRQHTSAEVPGEPPRVRPA
jgi:hypothetical protein